MGIYFTTFAGEKDSKIRDEIEKLLIEYFGTVLCEEPNDAATILSRVNNFREHRSYCYPYEGLLFKFYEELDYDDYAGESAFLGKPGAFFYIDPVIFNADECYTKNPGSDNWWIFLTYTEVGICLELAMVRYFESETCHFTGEEKSVLEETVKALKHKLAMDDDKSFDKGPIS